MDCITHMKKSIKNSIKLGIFKSYEISAKHHIFSSEFIKYPIEKCRYLYNFDKKHLINDINNINNYKYIKNIKNIMKNINIIKTPSDFSSIWIINHNNRDVLLYGIDYIIASNIMKHKDIYANYINI